MATTKCRMCSGGGAVCKGTGPDRRFFGCPECDGSGWVAVAPKDGLGGLPERLERSMTLIWNSDTTISEKGVAYGHVRKALRDLIAACDAAEDMVYRLLQYETECPEGKHALGLIRDALLEARSTGPVVTL